MTSSIIASTPLKIGFLTLVLASAASLFAQASKWPTIRPLEEKKVFINPGQNNTDTPFLTFIKASDGVPAYKLECHNGNYEDESEMNSPGIFNGIRQSNRICSSRLGCDGLLS